MTARTNPSPSLLEQTPSARRWRKFFLYTTATLATTILLKIAAVQYLEILYLVNIAVLLYTAVRRRLHFRVIRPFFFLMLAYFLFSAAAFALSLAALRYTFIFPTGTSWQRMPVWITVLRIVELIASVTAMTYMAHIFAERPSLLRATMRIYYWVAVTSVLYSLLTFPLAYEHIVYLGVYLSNHRFRGFYNEGGPWGLYLISAILVSIALKEKRWLSLRSVYLGWLLLGIGLFFSYSKAAYAALLLLLAAQVLITYNSARRIFLAVGLLLLIAIGSVALNYNADIARIDRQAEAYERLSAMHSQDPNFIAGRVAGAFIIPRMIEHHPWTGIGWGNYPLLRNRPEYRGASVWFDGIDDPGLGLLTYLGELGFPAFFFLLACLLTPLALALRWKSPSYIVNLALLQPLCHLFGAQLNLTYPWVATAFVLGLAYSFRSQQISLRLQPEAF